MLKTRKDDEMRQETKLEAEDIKMLYFSEGVTKKDRTRNENLKGTVQVGCFGDEARGGTVNMLGGRWKMAGRGPRGRTKRSMDVVKEAMKVDGARKEGPEGRAR